MENYICRKCSSNEFFLAKKGTNIGLYCACSGNWVKWVGKDEVKSLERFYSYRDFNDIKPSNKEVVNPAKTVKLKQNSSMDKCKSILEFYGANNQRMLFAEECSRSIEAILKLNRVGNQSTHDTFIDCLSSLSILLEQMKLSLSQDDLNSFAMIVSNKLDRQIEFIEDKKSTNGGDYH